MSGTEMASGQSQSRSPFFVGSLPDYVSQITISDIRFYLLRLRLVKVIFVEDKGVGENISQQAS